MMLMERFMLRLTLLLLLIIEAQAKAADYVIHRSSEALHLWTEDAKPRHVYLETRFWSWEGSATNADLTETAQGLSAHINVDIIGPDWYRVDIVQEGGGIMVCATHTADQWSDARWYPSFEAMYGDDLGQFAAVILKRCNEGNPIFADSTLYAMRSGEAETIPPGLIQQLDADDWATRSRAARELRQESYLPALAQIDRTNLSAEQNARIDAILWRWAFDLPSIFFDSIKRP